MTTRMIVFTLILFLVDLCHAKLPENEIFFLSFRTLEECEAKRTQEEFTDPMKTNSYSSVVNSNNPFMLYRGIWRLSACNEKIAECGIEGFPEAKVVFSEEMSSCEEYPFFNLNRRHLMAMKFGNKNLEFRELEIYSENNFVGDNLKLNETVTFARAIANLETLEYIPFVAKSWHYTGNQEWTLYEKNDYEGDSWCLEATPGMLKKGYGLAANLAENPGIPVGSIRQGCDPNAKRLSGGKSVLDHNKIEL